MKEHLHYKVGIWYLVFGILRLSSTHVCSVPYGIIYIIPLSEHINASDEVIQLEREPSGISIQLPLKKEEDAPSVHQ